MNPTPHEEESLRYRLSAMEQEIRNIKEDIQDQKNDDERLQTSVDNISGKISYIERVITFGFISVLGISNPFIQHALDKKVELINPSSDIIQTSPASNQEAK